MLDAVEALLLDGGDELAVDDERRRRVAVEGVQAEDRGRGGGGGAGGGLLVGFGGGGGGGGIVPRSTNARPARRARRSSRDGAAGELLEDVPRSPALRRRPGAPRMASGIALDRVAQVRDAGLPSAIDSTETLPYQPSRSWSTRRRPARSALAPRGVAALDEVELDRDAVAAESLHRGDEVLGPFTRRSLGACTRAQGTLVPRDGEGRHSARSTDAVREELRAPAPAPRASPGSARRSARCTGRSGRPRTFARRRARWK